MAATNYTPIQLYFSTTASAVPLAANLAQGELAINITDGKLYYEDNAGVVQVIATKGAGTIGGSTTQIQYNNAGALAGNAAMTFNSGTNTTTLTTLNLTNALGATYGGTAQSAYAQGDFLYASATNTLSKLSIGTVNYILTSTGSVPQWSAPSSIIVQTATNLAGGAGGSVPYQSAVDTTTFLAIGAANRVMTSSGTVPQWVTSLTGLTGVSSSSITNTSLTSGRVVVSTTGGAQADDADLTFDGTTLSAGGYSTAGLTTLVKTVKIGDSNFSGVAVFAAATPAKLYIGTGTVTDTTSAIGATNAVGAISSLAITPIAATNTTVTYTNAATLYIAGAPSAGTNVTLTNPYSLYVAAGNSYFGGTVTYAGGINFNGNVTVGDSSADTLTINSTITSNLIFTDNTYDIGASGATRPRTGYFGTSVITPALTVSGLTSGRVPYLTTGGLFTSSGNLLFDGQTLSVANTAAATPLSSQHALVANGNSNVTARFDGTGETYLVNTQSLKNQYMQAGTLIVVNAVPPATPVNSGALIDFNAYNAASGASNVFIGAVAGNTNAAANFVIGRRTGTSNWAESVRVNTLGYMGIGTNNPGQILELGGTNPTMNIGPATASSGGYIGYNTSGNYLFINAVSQGVAYRNIAIANDGGNVGIGHTTPNVKLDLRGTSDTTGATVQIVGNVVSSLLLGQNADGGVIRGQGGSDVLAFWVGGLGDTAAGGSGSEVGRFASTGNFGIGTTTPSNKLNIVQIKSGTGVESYDLVRLNFSGTSAIGDSANIIFANAQGTKVAGISGILGADNIAYGSLSFSVRRFTTDTYDEAVRINNRGFVGIGATNPQTNLTVGATAASGGASGGLGAFLSRGVTTNFYEAFDGTKSFIAGVDNTQAYAKVGTLSQHPVALVAGNGNGFLYLATNSGVTIGSTTAAPASGLRAEGSIKAVGGYVSTEGILGFVASNYSGTRYWVLHDMTGNPASAFNCQGGLVAASYSVWNNSNIFIRRSYNTYTVVGSITGIANSGVTVSIVDISYSSNRYIALKFAGGDPAIEANLVGYLLDQMYVNGAATFINGTAGVTENAVIASYP